MKGRKGERGGHTKPQYKSAIQNPPYKFSSPKFAVQNPLYKSAIQNPPHRIRHKKSAIQVRHIKSLKTWWTIYIRGDFVGNSLHDPNTHSSALSWTRSKDCLRGSMSPLPQGTQGMRLLNCRLYLILLQRKAWCLGPCYDVNVNACGCRRCPSEEEISG